MDVFAPVLEDAGIDFDRDDLEMVYPSEEGGLLTTKNTGKDDVYCERCETLLAREFDWFNAGPVYTECHNCGATVQLGSLG